MNEIRRDTHAWRVVLLTVVLLAIGGVVATALHAVAPEPSGRASCRRLLADSNAMVARAEDTIGRIRGVPQRITASARDLTGYRVRTEDSRRGALHDGGLVHFDCAGRMAFVWLDGG